jgi:hypothetical protein
VFGNTWKYWYFTLIVIAILGCDTTESPSNGYADPLYGTWEFTGYDSNVFPSSSGVTWEFTSDSVTIVMEIGSFPGTYQVDRRANPKAIDLRFIGSDTVLGIYKHVGSDSLIIKYGPDSLVRTRSFKIESGYPVWYFRRHP